MTATTPFSTIAPAAIDPRLARAEFFCELEMAELTVTIPVAAPLVSAPTAARY